MIYVFQTHNSSYLLFPPGMSISKTIAGLQGSYWRLQVEALTKNVSPSDVRPYPRMRIV